MSFSETSDSMEIDPATPPNLLEISELAVSGLVPEKSKSAYEKTYDNSITWQKKMKTLSFSMHVVLAYFKEKSETYKPTTHWSEFSKLAATLKVKNNVQIDQYSELKAFSKKKSTNFSSKKARLFTSKEFEKFLNEAPNSRYLATKVRLIYKFSKTNYIFFLNSVLFFLGCFNFWNARGLSQR